MFHSKPTIEWVPILRPPVDDQIPEGLALDWAVWTCIPWQNMGNLENVRTKLAFKWKDHL
jgi:hypothetical protein